MTSLQRKHGNGEAYSIRFSLDRDLVYNSNERKMDKGPSPVKHTGAAILALFLFFTHAGNVLAQKFQLSVFAGVNRVSAYGEDADYVLGENDFPVTPAHSPFALGASFTFFFTKNLGVEADGRYILSSKVTLLDPSDQDTVGVDTAKHFSLTLTVIYQFLTGKFRPYLVIGGGFDRIQAKSASYITEYGFEIAVEAPESKMDPVANFGTGLIFDITDRFGIRLDLRYAVIFSDPDRVSGLNTAAGVSFQF